MSAQLYDTRRPKLDGPWDQASAAAARTAFAGLITYFGRYTVDANAGTVTHVVAGAMAPDMIGSSLVRAYRFRGPDRLELRAIANGDGLPAPGGDVLVWERVRR